MDIATILGKVGLGGYNQGTPKQGRWKQKKGTKPKKRKGLARVGPSEKALARRKAGKSRFDGKATLLVQNYRQARIPVTITTSKGIFYTGRKE
jgi:hypothetical protein